MGQRFMICLWDAVSCTSLMITMSLLKEIPSQQYNGVLGIVKYPWKITDWIEEIDQISSHLVVNFHHNQREANDIADG